MLIYLNGLLLGLSLIMALGPQNIFLMKQGARRNHAALSALVCFSCDIILVSASIAGLHRMLEIHPVIQTWITSFGSAFLLYYAIKTLKNAFASNTTGIDKSHKTYTRAQIILFALGFSLLNPHAIIDTLVIIGSGSSQFPDHELLFLCGVITSSFLWFSSLTVTTRYFSHILTRTSVWQFIEFFSSFVMAFLGIKLLVGVF